jgi:hypothetical protein
MKWNFNKLLYAGFVFFGLYVIFFKHDYSEASMFFGIALAFDPFDQAQPWQDRPMWQKAWLIVHLAIVAALLGYDIGFNDSVK